MVSNPVANSSLRSGTIVGGGSIDKIIAEEKSHLRHLSEFKKKLSQQ